MIFTQNSRSNHLALDDVLARLADSPQVDGLALFGSRAVGISVAEASDYDLLILVDELPITIFQMLTHIDGHLTDVVFVLTDMVDRLLTEAPVVFDRSNEGRFLLKMATAQIVYDASGRLSRAQAYARHNPPAVTATFPAIYSTWFWQCLGLFHMQRLARSSDPIRLTTVDLMLSNGINEACRNYCLLRGIPWQGEKTALRFLQAHDPAYLALLRSCLAETERARRVHLFEQLVVATLQSTGETWQTGLTAIALEVSDYSPTDVNSALEYWESFFAQAPAI